MREYNTTIISRQLKPIRNLLAIILTLCIVNNSTARCIEQEISFLPKSEHIYRNSLIIIELTLDYQEIAGKLNNEYPVYLNDGKKNVDLFIIETLSSGNGVTQVVLRPKKTLKKGKTYSILIDNLPSNLKKFKKQWTVRDTRDEEIPKLLAEPQELTKIYNKKPEGAEKFIRFETRYTDNSEVLIQCTLKDSTGQQIAKQLIAVDKHGQIAIGQMPCFGLFKMTDGTKYVIDFQILDICGNYGEIIYKNIPFISPKPPRVVYKTTTTVIQQ